MSRMWNQFDIFNELSEHITIRINSCHRQSHDHHWVETKEHQDYDLWLVHSGRVDVRMNGENLTATAGDLIFLFPGIPYTASTGPEGCEFIYTHFDFAIGERTRILSEFNLSGIVSGASVREEAELFRASFIPYSKSTMLSNIRLRGCLAILLAKIIENHGHTGRSQPPTETKRKKSTAKHLDALRPVFDYIHRNLHTSIMIHELAEAAGMSEKYFITFFKNTVGLTPGKYLNQVRMNRARDYLYLKTYTVKQIAELLGYPDPYMFSKAFKKYYNVPPSKFV